MIRIRPVVITVVTAFALSVFWTSACSNMKRGSRSGEGGKNKLTIGIIMPLTGALAQYGKNCVNGINLAVSEVNQSGKLEFKTIVEDERTSPKDAVAAFNKLVSADRVSVIVGPLASSSVMAVAPLANQNRVIVFSPGASSPKLTGAGPYVFRDWQSDALEAKVMSTYLLKQGHKRVAILAVNNDFGVALANYFTQNFSKSGGMIVATDTFEQDATDFRAQLAMIKRANPGALYLLSYPQETALIVNQAREIGLRTPIFGVAAMEDPTLLKIARGNANGITFTKAIEPGQDDPVYKHFVAAYQARYGEAPGLIADTAFDAVKMIAYAAARVSTLDAPSIAAELAKIRNFSGASGQMSFDENHDIIKPIGIRTIRQGQFVWMTKTPN